MIALRLSRRALIASGAALVLAACGDSTSTPATPARFSTTYVFGASLDDTGNSCNLSATACPPPPYATGRFSNGPLWVEIVAQQYGATVTPSRTGGTNYAFGGARTGPITGTTQSVPNMVQQVALFNAAPAASTPNRATALFVVNAATVGNDITDALAVALTSPTAAQTIVTNAVTNTITIIGQLYAAGARNILIANSTDIGRTPLVRAQGALAIAAATQFSTLFNSTLALQLPAARTAAPGATITLLDLGALTNEILSAPATFGFTNITAPCVVTTPPSVCTTPDAYFFWDGFHPTNATGKIVAQRAITALGR